MGFSAGENYSTVAHLQPLTESSHVAIPTFKKFVATRAFEGFVRETEEHKGAVMFRECMNEPPSTFGDERIDGPCAEPWEKYQDQYHAKETK